MDIFGEIAGIAFTPHSDCFFVGVADLTYSSLLEFDQADDERRSAQRTTHFMKGADLGGWGMSMIDT